MAALDQQLGFADESTFGTLVTPTKFFEFESESIEETEGRTEGDPLRVGTYVKRNDRFTPYFDEAAGTVSMAVLSKGFGYFLKHMMGAVATGGLVDSTYTHTGTFADLLGKFFTAQFSRPFMPAGTAQAFAYLGGKITKWTLQNAVDGNLMLDLDLNFANVDTATALATAAYPASMEPLSWAGGVVSIAGSNYDITEFSLSCDNGLDVGRKMIRGSTTKKEPVGGRRSIEFSLSADFDSLTNRTRAHSVTRAGALAQIIGTWTAPTLAGSTTYPKLIVTIPACRFDKWAGHNDGPTGISQQLSGVGLYDGSASPVTIAYTSTDATP